MNKDSSSRPLVCMTMGCPLITIRTTISGHCPQRGKSLTPQVLQDRENITTPKIGKLLAILEICIGNFLSCFPFMPLPNFHLFLVDSLLRSWLNLVKGAAELIVQSFHSHFKLDKARIRALNPYQHHHQPHPPSNHHLHHHDQHYRHHFSSKLYISVQLIRFFRFPSENLKLECPLIQKVLLHQLSPGRWFCPSDKNLVDLPWPLQLSLHSLCT